MFYFGLFLIFISVIFAFLSYWPTLADDLPDTFKEIYDVIADLTFATFVFIVGFVLLFIFG